MDAEARLQQRMDEHFWTIFRVAKEADIPWPTVSKQVQVQQGTFFSILRFWKQLL